MANGISNPTVFSFAPDGRIFVAQQNGQLRIVKNGALLPTPFISLSVSSSGERGLLGIAFDPDFASNQYIYLYYTLNPATNNRISRFTANGDIVVPGSEVVLLNLDPLSSATNHNGGTMQFGLDGKLYVGIGENANTSFSQSLTTYHGKVLRLNSDGSAPSDNPFIGSANVKTQRIWAFGLRNPYTLAVQPGTGRIFVNDVGQSSWEEINDATTGGRNFGWPSAEGNSSNPAFTNPIYAYRTGSAGCAITGGTFFNPTTTNYPASYIGKYFFLDFCNRYIDALNLSGSTAVREGFATNIAGSPVNMATGPDGNLYFLSRSTSALYRVSYSSPTAPPTITNQPQSLTVNLGNPAIFSVTANGPQTLFYQWKKGTIDIPGAIFASYTIPNSSLADAGTYSVVVSYIGGTPSTTSNPAILTVESPNQKPSAIISSPSIGSTYGGGQVIQYAGAGSDPESGNLPASAFTWYIDFHHDDHTHPELLPISGASSGSFTVPTSGETATNVWYRIYLVVSDPQGLKDTTFRDVFPRVSGITLNTNPQGLQVALDGQFFTAPYTTASVEGIIRNIGVISPQGNYTFGSWTHGGANYQDIVTPATNISYTANMDPTPGTTLTSTISPMTGTYDGPQLVTITSNSPGATIYYTTSGNIPVLGAGFTRLYTAPFNLIESGTIRAMAVQEGRANSPIAVSFITIINPGIVSAPSFSPAAGTYGTSQIVSLVSATPGAAIYYTINGNLPRFDVPNSFTRLYTGPILVQKSTPIRAIALKGGLINSTLVLGNFTITNPATTVATPSISPTTGIYAGAQTVTMATTTPGATIYFTTNGNSPRLDVPNFFTKVYTGPFEVGQSTFIRALATAPGANPSGIALSIVTIGAGRMASFESEDENLMVDSDLQVYPNPSASGYFKFKWDEAVEKEARVEVMALDGRLVQRLIVDPDQQELMLNLSHEPAGMFLVRIFSENGVVVRRISKR